jgi:hypothetical protein
MFLNAFLSLWIQNTSAASMMLPIIIALVKQLTKYDPSYSEINSKNPSKIHPQEIETISLNEVEKSRA